MQRIGIRLRPRIGKFFELCCDDEAFFMLSRIFDAVDDFMMSMSDTTVYASISDKVSLDTLVSWT
jgi:hypothetical protein